MKFSKIALFFILSLNLTTIYAEAPCIYLDFTYDNVKYHINTFTRKHGFLHFPDYNIARLEQAAFYGPDYILNISLRNDPEKFINLEIQQNYCFLEAGEITVKKLSTSNPTFSPLINIKEGSYAENEEGRIYFS